MSYDILSGLTGAVSGATPSSTGEAQVRRLRNKQPSAPMPDTYGGAGESTSSGGDSNDRTSYKRGGKVKRTGTAKLHKGERVLTAKQARKYSKKRGHK